MRVLVLGASQNPQRYSNMAMKDLQYFKHTVIAVGRKAGEVQGMRIVTDFPQDEKVDTVTVYLNERNQEPYIEAIKNIRPNRVIFNPGAENRSFYRELEAIGIESINACTLVMLRTNQF